MNTTEKHIHQNLKNDWSNFPFKLDYIFYLLYKNEQNISDVFLVNTGNDYVVDRFRSMGYMHIDFEHKDLTINQDELFEYLKISNPTSEFLQFGYTTSIFSEKYNFRCQKDSRDLICFRLLDSRPPNLNQLFNLGGNITPVKPNIRLGQFNQEFSNLLEKYNLYDDLKQHLDNKNLAIEKKLKV